MSVWSNSRENNTHHSATIEWLAEVLKKNPQKHNWIIICSHGFSGQTTGTFSSYFWSLFAVENRKCRERHTKVWMPCGLSPDKFSGMLLDTAGMICPRHSHFPEIKTGELEHTQLYQHLKPSNKLQEIYIYPTTKVTLAKRWCIPQITENGSRP